MTEQTNDVGDAATQQAEAPAGRAAVKWVVWIVVALVVGAAAYGAYYVYAQSQTRDAARDKVTQATKLIEDADTVVLDVDEVVRAEITAEIGEQAAELQERVPAALEDLDEAVALIDEAVPDLADEDVARAEALRASAQARSEMLATTGPILEANIKAAAALQPSLDAWEKVLEAETVADESVAEYNKLTDESVKRSLELTDEALALYGEAKDLFSMAATGFPEADFSAYEAYVDGKVELLGISKQANEAFIAGEKEKANTLSDQYNAKDKELVEQAKKLPDTPGEIVAGAYEEIAGEATDEYFEARERATEADEQLKNLGG